VLKPCLTALPFNLTVIDSIEPQALVASPPGPLAITLLGHGLDTNDNAIFTTPGRAESLFGIIQPGGSRENLMVTLPPELRPGVNVVQLVQPAPVLSPPACDPHVRSQSNAVAFMLVPALTQVDPSGPDQLQAVVWPPVGPLQQVSLLLNQTMGSPPSRPLAFALPADAHPTETDTFTFSTKFLGGSVPSGSYLARIRVDSAESRLTVNLAGTFDGPTVIIS